ncbi:hypothetical protein ACR6CX_032490, partial [Pseudomonas aeruginosa]
RNGNSPRWKRRHKKHGRRDNYLEKRRVQDALTTLTMIASMNPPPFDYFPPIEHDRKVTKIDKYRK